MPKRAPRGLSLLFGLTCGRYLSKNLEGQTPLEVLEAHPFFSEDYEEMLDLLSVKLELPGEDPENQAGGLGRFLSNKPEAFEKFVNDMQQVGRGFIVKCIILGGSLFLVLYAVFPQLVAFLGCGMKMKSGETTKPALA